MKHILYLAAIVLLAVSCQNSEVSSQKSAGTVVRDTIHGTPCCVYLPNEVPSTKYPVLYLQHGMYGNEDDWRDVDMIWGGMMIIRRTHPNQSFLRSAKRRS